MTQAVMSQNATVAVFDSHRQVEESVRRLRQAGFDLGKVSVVATDHHPGEAVVAHYGVGGQARCCGEFGPFWTAMWASLSGWGYLLIPNVGRVLVAGPLGGWIVAALENQEVFGGLTGLGAALYGLGIPKDEAVRCEVAVRMHKLLLIAHGAIDEVGKAREVMR